MQKDKNKQCGGIAEMEINLSLQQHCKSICNKANENLSTAPRQNQSNNNTKQLPTKLHNSPSRNKTVFERDTNYEHHTFCGTTE